MSSFTPQQIEDFLQEFFDVVGTRQYVGARYVPIFGRAGSDTVEWDNLAPYEPLTVVMHNGVSYVSRRYVPRGIDISDTSYWAETYRFNAQVEQYRQEVLGFSDRITLVNARVDGEAQDREQADDEVREWATDTFVPYPDGTEHPKFGTEGQVLTSLGDGQSAWEDPVEVTPELAGPLIDDWLDAHPEATTTVTDGSVTTAKLADGAVKTPKLADGAVTVDKLDQTEPAGRSVAIDELLSDRTANLIDAVSADVKTLWCDPTDGKLIKSLNTCNSVIVPVDPTVSGYVAIHKPLGAQLRIANLSTLEPVAGETTAMGTARVTLQDGYGTWALPAGVVALLVWYFYEDVDGDTDPYRILASMSMNYGILSLDHEPNVPHGYGDVEAMGKWVRDTQNLIGDSPVVENVFIDTNSQKLVRNNSCRTVIVDVSDVGAGNKVYVHRGLSGSFSIATFTTRPQVNSTQYARVVQGLVNSTFNLKDTEFTLQAGETHVAVWFYYDHNQGTPLENLRMLYVGTVPYDGSEGQRSLRVDRDALDATEEYVGPLDFDLYDRTNNANDRVYLNNFLYHPGYVERVDTFVTGNDDQDVYVFIVNPYNNVIMRKFTATGQGDVSVPVRMHIGIPFYLGIGGLDCAFSSFGSVSNNLQEYHFSPAHYEGDTLPISFTVTPSFSICQRVVYAPTKEQVYGESVTCCRNNLFVAGDSITAGYPSYVVGNHWWEGICRKYGMVAHPAARSGSGFSYYNGTNACKIAHNTTFTGMDVALFAFGTNDYGNNIPIGTIDDVYTYSEDSSQTFYACVKYVIETVKTKNPACTLMFSLPINRSDKGTLAAGYGYGTPNTEGHTLLDYCEAIVACCERYGIPYIDNRRGSFDVYSLTTLLVDNLHPTPLGYKVLGSDMVAKFGALWQPFPEYDGVGGYGEF